MWLFKLSVHGKPSNAPYLNTNKNEEETVKRAINCHSKTILDTFVFWKQIQSNLIAISFGMAVAYIVVEPGERL